MTDEPAGNTGPPMKLVAIEWPESGTAVFANHLLAQTDSKFVYLTFAQVVPPLVLPSNNDDLQRQMDQLTGVKAFPVAKVVVSVEEYRRMVGTMQQHLHNVEQLLKKKADNDADTVPPVTS